LISKNEAAATATFRADAQKAHLDLDPDYIISCVRETSRPYWQKIFMDKLKVFGITVLFRTIGEDLHIQEAYPKA
jgi:hypothetical protein